MKHYDKPRRDELAFSGSATSSPCGTSSAAGEETLLDVGDEQRVL